MRSTKSRFVGVLVAAVVVFLLHGVGLPVASGADIAKVNDETITSDELDSAYRLIQSSGQEELDTTFKAKEEFLDRVISKHLLSQLFRSRGWDTLSAWDTLLVEYERGQFVQALYNEMIPEARVAGTVEVPKLMELTRQYVDSLQKAYHLVVDEKAVVFIADRSVVRRMDMGQKGQQELVWRNLFTDEEKKMSAATMAGGVLTIGELVESIDRLPSFARPTGGNTDEIALTIEHFAREKIFELEFNKLGLRNKPYFHDRVMRKREEILLDQLFNSLQDTSNVTEDEVKEYYESHRDDFMTVPVINMAVMTFSSEDVARRAAKKIEDGQAFESVAVEFSVFSGSTTGFDTTGFVARDKGPALFDAILDKPIGTTVGPIAVESAWKVAKLLGRQDPRLLNLDEATPMIVERLRFQKGDRALAEMLADLRAKAKIEVNEAALEAFKIPK